MMLSRTVSLVSRRSGALVAPAAPRLAAVPMTLHRRAYASSSPDSFPQLPPGFEKLAHSPTALSAIQNLVELMKKNGVDLTSGEKPSMWQLMKLATNSEVKTATSKVMEELKNAGIDVSPERLQAIMNSQGDLFKGGKDGDSK